jgi:hypothetical protein
MKVYSTQEFINLLKTNDLKKIKEAYASIIKTNKKILSEQDRNDLIADNVCLLNINVLSDLIETYKIKYYDGDDSSMYENAVECPSHVFGFIHAYYAVDGKTKFDAYRQAIKKNRLDILKKIRDLSTKSLEKIRQHVSKDKTVSPEIIEYIKSEHRKSRADKDTSPEDMLNKKFKKQISSQSKKSRTSVTRT